MTVAEVQERMTAREFSEWMAYNQAVSPVDSDFRFEHAIAGLSSLLANLHRDTKKRKQPFAVVDFLPDWDEDGRRRVDEEDEFWTDYDQPWEDWRSTGAAATPKRSTDPQTPQSLQAKAKFWTQVLGGTFNKTVSAGGTEDAGRPG